MPIRRKGGSKFGAKVQRALATSGRARAANVDRFRTAVPRWAGARGVTATELHYFGANATGDITTTGTVNLCNGMAQGPDVDERLGNKIVMKSLEIRLLMTNEIGMLHIRSPVRMLVVYDRQTNGAAPAYTDVCSATMVGITNIANRDRFLILKDTIIEFNTMGATNVGVGLVQIVKKFYFDLKGLTATFSSAAAGVGAIMTGGVFVLLEGVIPVGSVDIDATLTTRLRYLA